MLGHKESIGKFKKTQVLSNVFSRHNTGRLEINYKKKKKCKKHKHTEAKKYAIK